MADSNPFDQFDEPAAAGNPFDQFDDAPAPPPPASLARKVADVGLSVGKGIIGVPEVAVGLADLVTGGAAGKAAEAAGVRFEDAKQVLTDLQSDDLKAKQQAFSEADGILPKVGEALSNPSLIVNTVAESLPVMGAGGVVARGVLPALGARMSRPAAAAAAGAIGEGAVGAGSAAEQIRQQTEDGYLTPGQAAAAAGSGIATGVIGAAGGALARRLGVGDPESLIAAGGREVVEPAARLGAKPKGMLRRTAEGALVEGAFEEVPQSLSEQAFQNVALDRPITEGMADAAVMGGLAGGVMGGVAGAISRPVQPPPPPAPPPPGPLTSALHLLPAPGSLPPAGEAIQVDSEGTAARGTEFDYMRGTSRGAREGVKKGPPTRPIGEAGGGQGRDKTGPALRLPPPTINVDSEGTARAPGQNVQPRTREPGPLETGAAIGRGRNSDRVNPRQLPAPPSTIEVDPQGVAATGPQRGGATISGREAAAAEAQRRQQLGLNQVRDGDVLAENGKPFRARFAAVRAAKQAGPGFQVAEVDGGFVARRAKEAAQDVEVKDAAPPQPAPAAVPGAAAPAPSPAPVESATGERAGAVPAPVAPAPPVPPAAPAAGPAPAVTPPVSPPSKGLRVGVTPNDAEPVTVRDGVVYVGKYAAVNFDSGEEVRVPPGATELQIRKALADAGSLSKRQKFFGGGEATAPAPTVAPAPPPQQNEGSGPAAPVADTSEKAEAALDTTPPGATAAPPTAADEAPDTPPTGDQAPAPAIKLIGKPPNVAVLIDGIPHRSGFKTELQARQAAEQEIIRREALKRGAELEAEDREQGLRDGRYTPEGTDGAGDPQRVPGERWTQNRGAVPGEAMAWLDGDEDTAKAALYQVEQAGGTSTYEVRAPGGRVLARGSTPAEAAARAEANLAEPPAPAPAPTDDGSTWNTAGELSYRRMVDGSLEIRGPRELITSIGANKARIQWTDGGARLAAKDALGMIRRILDHVETGKGAPPAPVVNGRERAADVKPQESLLLMPCSGSKLDTAAEPGKLYTGPMWQTLRERVKEGAEQPRIAILSAKHGILGLRGEKIEPYDQVIDEERARYFLHHTELPKLVKALQDQLRGAKIRDVQIVGGEHYRKVMAAVVRGVMDGQGGLIERDASVRETTGRGIGDHRAQLSEYLNGFKPAAAPAPAAPAGPTPEIEATPAADRVKAVDDGSYLDSWETTSEPPTDAEIAAAAQVIKPGMYLHPNYGVGVNHEVVAVRGPSQGEYDGGPSVDVEVRNPARPRQRSSYHSVFLRNGKLYDATPDWSDDDTQTHARIYVLDGPMQLGAAPAPAPTPAPAPAAPVKASRETIELRKRVISMDKLLDCLKKGAA